MRRQLLDDDKEEADDTLGTQQLLPWLKSFKETKGMLRQFYEQELRNQRDAFKDTMEEMSQIHQTSLESVKRAHETEKIHLQSEMAKSAEANSRRTH